MVRGKLFIELQFMYIAKKVVPNITCIIWNFLRARGQKMSQKILNSEFIYVVIKIRVRKNPKAILKNRHKTHLMWSFLFRHRILMVQKNLLENSSIKR